MKAVVIGGGPAGLMAAGQLSAAGAEVAVFDAMPSVGRKFLLAGKGGLNLTHAEPFAKFLTRFGGRPLDPFLTVFGPADVRRWCETLGIETFVGSSLRVFPREMKAAPLLRAWLRSLRGRGVTFHVRHRWRGWDRDALMFESPAGVVRVNAGAVVLALGGGSWPQLGSDGAWVPVLRERGIGIADLQPANCGFDVGWSEVMRSRFAGAPVKPVVATFGSERRQGEFIVTETGIEGGLIYAFSAGLRDAIAREGTAVLTLDLAPHLSLAEIARPRGKASLATHLRKRAGLDGVRAGLVRECVPAADLADDTRLATHIKALRLTLLRPRPLPEAISSAGGVQFDQTTPDLMLKTMPGVFCAGEMLDWEAPTGGYLLTASLATGYAAGRSAAAWLKQRP